MGFVRCAQSSRQFCVVAHQRYASAVAVRLQNETKIELSQRLRTRQALKGLISRYDSQKASHAIWQSRLQSALERSEGHAFPNIASKFSLPSDSMVSCIALVIGDRLGGTRAIVDALLRDPLDTSSVGRAVGLRQSQVGQVYRFS